MRSTSKSFTFPEIPWLDIPFFLVKVCSKVSIRIEMPLEGCVFVTYPSTLISYESISTMRNIWVKDINRYHGYKGMEGRVEGKSLFRNQQASLFWLHRTQQCQRVRTYMFSNAFINNIQMAIALTDFKIRIFVILDNRYPKVGPV